MTNPSTKFQIASQIIPNSCRDSGTEPRTHMQPTIPKFAKPWPFTNHFESRPVARIDFVVGGCMTPRKWTFRTHKVDFFEPHPLNPPTKTSFLARFVTKSGPFGRWGEGGGASHQCTPLATGLLNPIIPNSTSLPPIWELNPKPKTKDDIKVSQTVTIQKQWSVWIHNHSTLNSAPSRFGNWTRKWEPDEHNRRHQSSLKHDKISLWILNHSTNRDHSQFQSHST